MRLLIVAAVISLNSLPFAFVLLLNWLGTDSRDVVWLLLLCMVVLAGVLTRFRHYPRVAARITQTIRDIFNSEQARKLNMLRATRSFSLLSIQQLRLLSTHARVVAFRANEVIFHEGDVGVDLYIITQGNVLVYREKESSPFEIKVFGDGEFFGEMALLDEKTRSANARAISDVEMLMLDRRFFLEAVRIEPGISIFIMKELSLRTRDFNAYAEQLAHRYSEVERIALRLLGLAAQIGEFEGSLVRMRRELVQDVLGEEMTSETIKAHLSHIEQAGDIIVEAEYVIMPDYYALFKRLFSDHGSPKAT